MLQEIAQTLPAKITLIEAGVAVGLAILLVEKIVSWIAKLMGKSNGNGKKNPCVLKEGVFEIFTKAVEKTHDKQCGALDAQTLVLDRIYQAQALQLKALEKITDRLEDTKH
ncbi:MAG: hypothetical protein MZV49_24285 [Rhodopseudomonas palustris]|nr:hypothetical protein [Rhodopseudomonas palustris]